MGLAIMLMIFSLLVFAWGCTVFPMSDVATVATTVTAIIGAFAIWFQMKRERDIKEAEFIMSYNTSFIENGELSTLEKELEDYRKLVEAGVDVKKLPPIVREDNIHSVINFLVYHEALATFVKNRVLSMKHIDDLFAYRFFLVMNNPDVQKKELCPEAQYYRGCFYLYKVWVKYRRKKGLYVLLDQYSLEKTDAYKKMFRV